jgi:hypothetical protein
VLPNGVQHVTFAPAGLAEIETTDALPDYLLTPAGGTTQVVSPVEGGPAESAIVQYFYNITNPNSSNSGLEQDDAGVVYLFEDFRHQLSLVFHLDEAGGASGGDLCVSATMTGLDGASLVLVADDPADGLTWTPGAGSGQLCWNWPAGQTDGVVLSLPYPEPGREWSITFDMQSFGGLGDFLFLSGAGGGTPIDLADGFSFTIEAGRQASVPEPALAPALLGLAGWLAWRRRTWRRAAA